MPRPASAFWVSGIWFEPDIDAALAGPSKMFATVDNRQPADVVDVVVDLFAVVIEFERGDAVELSFQEAVPALGRAMAVDIAFDIPVVGDIARISYVSVIGVLSGIDAATGDQLVEAISFRNDMTEGESSFLLSAPPDLAWGHPRWAGKPTSG